MRMRSGIMVFAALAAVTSPAAAQHGASRHDAAQHGAAHRGSPPYRAVATPDMTGDRLAVAGVVQDLFDAMRAGDSATVRRVFHPEARMVTSFRRNGEPVLSIEADGVDGFANAVGTPHDQIWDERVWDVMIEVDDDFAMAWMDYAFFAGENFSHCGIDLFEFVRTADGWKILSIADTRRRQGCDLPADMTGG